MAESKKFIWVEINRDHQPEIPKKFNVSSYPSCILLGKNQEKVHRFSSYMKPSEFLAELQEGLTRYGLYKQGKEWDTPNPRPTKLCEQGTVSTWKAPSEAIPAGMTFLGRDLWIGQRGQLYCVDPDNGKVKKTFPLPETVVDIATDGKLLYALDKGWTAGFPIYIIDPETGKQVGTIVTEANKKFKSYGAGGIVWRGDRLYVLELGAGKLHELNTKTGDILKTIETKERYVIGLAYDGHNFATVSRKEMVFLNPDTGEATRRIPVNYPLQMVAHSSGSYYVMEQPVPGFDKEHKSIRVWPKEMLVYKLVLPPLK